MLSILYKTVFRMSLKTCCGQTDMIFLWGLPVKIQEEGRRVRQQFGIGI